MLCVNPYWTKGTHRPAIFSLGDIIT